MKLKLLIFILLNLLVFIPIFSKLKKEGKVKPTKKITKEKQNNKCCIVNADYNNKVRIQQICVKDQEISIELKFLKEQKVCTILENLTLTDNKRKKYSPIDYSGINPCPNSQIVKTGDIFYWSFEKFDSNIKSFNLSETELEDSGLNAWTWKDVDVTHCKF